LTGTAQLERGEVIIPLPPGQVCGELTIPHGADSVVIFAHGSGSSRHSPRNQFVAQGLQKTFIGTLLMDLLTEAEEEWDSKTARLRFNIDLLAERLESALHWLRSSRLTRGLRVGCFGASTGAAAALVAAARLPQLVKAVVSRGGRPDLAGEYLSRVQCPTLLIVGGADSAVLELNRMAFSTLVCARRLEVVSGAGHLFEESGALAEVTRLASDWFSTTLAQIQEAGQS